MKKKVIFLLLFILVGASSLPQSQAGDEGVPKEVVDHLQMTVYVRAGESFAVYFDPVRKVIRTDPEFRGLPETVREALNRTPEWIRMNLTALFHRLPESVAERYARLILNCPERRYLDELAFSIAHTPPEVLSSSSVYPEVFLRNVEQLYWNDQYIDYADIVDYDNTSTIRYWVNSSGERLSFLLPREIYYWYVVHPKLTDEVPTLIDPSTGRPSSSGYFWRDYVFNHADPSYPSDTPTSTVLYPEATPPLLKDLLSGVDTLWNCTPYRAPAGYLDNGTGNRRPFSFGDHAIERVSNWVEKTLPLNVMEEGRRINSTPERSVQPVRIAHNHYGNCGELQDLTLAAARAALIPCRGVLNTGEDHVWCEFWERGWHHWDNYWSDGGTAVDNFHNYDADYPGSWGRDISTVFAWRGDDYVWTVTDEYTPSATLTTTVVDSSGTPLDGATVLLATENYYNPDYLTITAWGHTDLQGEARFIIGNKRNYWGEAHCSLGRDPQGSGGQIQVRSIITSSQAGTSYSATFHIPGALPQPQARLQEEPEGGEYVLKLNYSVFGAYIHPENLLTENTWMEEVEEGRWIDFYLVSGDPYGDFRAGRPFDALNVSEGSSSGELLRRIPSSDIYYGVFSNLRSLSTDRLIRINVTVYYIPAVVITSPGPGSKYVHTQMVEITGVTRSFAGVERVLWRVDGGMWDEAERTSEDWSTFRILLDTTPLAVGLHRVDVRAVTVEGKEVSTSITLEVYDAIPPGVNITTPDEDQVVVQGEPLKVEGYCWDDYSVVCLRLSVDGGEWINITSRIGEGGRWEVSLQTMELEVGDHTVSVEASDPSSHTASAEVPFYLTERVPPQVNITSPANGTIFKGGESVLLRGFADDNWKMSALIIYLDGARLKTVNLPEGGWWEYTITTLSLEDGPHTVEVVAVDSEGNENTTEVTFLLDSTSPRLTLLTPSTEVTVGPLAPLQVRVRVTEEMGIYEVCTTVDGRTYPAERVEGEVWLSVIDLSDLPGGRHRFVVRATDLAGNSETTAGTFILDRDAPQITTVPLRPAYVGEVIYINGSIYDPSGISSLHIVIGGREVNITGNISGGLWSYRWDTSGLHPGNYTITVVGSDGVGNIARLNLTVTLLEREVAAEEPREERERREPLPVALLLIPLAVALAAFLIYLLYRRRGAGGTPPPGEGPSPLPPAAPGSVPPGEAPAAPETGPIPPPPPPAPPAA